MSQHSLFMAATEEYIEEVLKPKEMDADDYIQLTKRALTEQDTTKKHFSYRLSQGQTNTELQVSPQRSNEQCAPLFRD